MPREHPSKLSGNALAVPVIFHGSIAHLCARSKRPGSVSGERGNFKGNKTNQYPRTGKGKKPGQAAAVRGEDSRERRGAFVQSIGVNLVLYPRMYRVAKGVQHIALSWKMLAQQATTGMFMELGKIYLLGVVAPTPWSHLAQ